jgi:molecular chaperone DnaJ
MPNVSGRGKGDLYVLVRASVPKKLTKEQKKLLEQLGNTMEPQKIDPATSSRDGDEKPFFEKVKDIFG